MHSCPTCSPVCSGDAWQVRCAGGSLPAFRQSPWKPMLSPAAGARLCVMRGARHATVRSPPSGSSRERGREGTTREKPRGRRRNPRGWGTNADVAGIPASSVVTWEICLAMKAEVDRTRMLVRQYRWSGRGSMDVWRTVKDRLLASSSPDNISGVTSFRDIRGHAEIMQAPVDYDRLRNCVRVYAAPAAVALRNLRKLKCTTLWILLIKITAERASCYPMSYSVNSVDRRKDPFRKCR